MRKAWLSRNLFKLHSWFGLVTGLFLILLGLSGSLLVFRTELDRFFNKELLHVPHQMPIPEQALQHCYDRITSRYPNLDGIAWLNPDAGPGDAYDFRIYYNDGQLLTYDLALISVDPYTGKVLREGPSDRFMPSFMAWLFQFHFSFQLGIPGAALTAILGMTMLVSLLTGVFVYRKNILKVLTFWVKINRKNWRTVSSDLHRIVGVWSLMLNAVIFFTGFWMNLFAFKPKTWQNELAPALPNTNIAVPADRMYRQALAAMPDLEPTYVYLPTQLARKFEVRGFTDGQFKIWGSANSVKIDQQTGEISGISRLTDKPLEDRIEAAFFPLHVGNFGGFWVKLVYVIIGLTPGLLAITGFLLWWRRQRFRAAVSRARITPV
ncbi:PepSY-associated TM helix domain-containing protein [Dyadobacter sandarakinus]|uniref:PepSY domain-containing protein n=1 Tax=Dyadobacter sandarakinus TaxID=2747268 RepID=A0ABX7I4B0_9BACT|nr:PepSY-associated TM helix domain-containing protein [Dyadobacter sandarakinus]QRR00063.1 PepSY domain-containing protein [Dyadobacter sandarakinus]